MWLSLLLVEEHHLLVSTINKDSPLNDVKFNKLREYSSGALWNITNSDEDSCIDLANVSKQLNQR